MFGFDLYSMYRLIWYVYTYIICIGLRGKNLLVKLYVAIYDNWKFYLIYTGNPYLSLLLNSIYFINRSAQKRKFIKENLSSGNIWNCVLLCMKNRSLIWCDFTARLRKTSPSIKDLSGQLLPRKFQHPSAEQNTTS